MTTQDLITKCKDRGYALSIYVSANEIELQISKDDLNIYRRVSNVEIGDATPDVLELVFEDMSTRLENDLSKNRKTCLKVIK